MEVERFQAISYFGKALWSEPEKALRKTLETVSASGLTDLEEEQRFARCFRAMVERAEREGSESSRDSLHLPFYRLSPKERIVLMALHRAHWSYDRIARSLGESSKQIAETAWKCRYYIACALNLKPPYPGIHSPTERCPSVDLNDPWTQRILDDEIGPTEKLFFQNHLMVCDPCRDSLNRFRDIYYAVETAVPDFAHADGLKSFQFSIWRTWRQSDRLRKTPIEIGFLESMRIFLKRGEVRLILVGMGLFYLIAWLI